MHDEQQAGRQKQLPHLIFKEMSRHQRLINWYLASLPGSGVTAQHESAWAEIGVTDQGLVFGCRCPAGGQKKWSRGSGPVAVNTGTLLLHPLLPEGWVKLTETMTQPWNGQKLIFCRKVKWVVTFFSHSRGCFCFGHWLLLLFYCWCLLLLAEVNLKLCDGHVCCTFSNLSSSYLKKPETVKNVQTSL